MLEFFMTMKSRIRTWLLDLVLGLVASALTMASAMTAEAS